MGKGAGTRLAKPAESRAGGHRLTMADRDAAAHQVAILGLPAVAMIDDHAVPAFAPFGPGAAAGVIGLSIARCDHRAGRRGQHRETRAGRIPIGHAHIGAIVAGVSPRAVMPIAPGVIGVVLHPAITARHAGQRQIEHRARGGRPGRQRQHQTRANDHATVSFAATWVIAASE